MKKIITTVGTSIITNCLQEDDSFISILGSVKDSFSDEWDSQKSNIEIIRKKVTSWANIKGEKASAEIQSILKIKEELNEEVEVYLISTDTVSSRLSAEIIKNFFYEFNANITVIFNFKEDVIKGLQVINKSKFEKEGLVELIKRIEEITENNWEDSVFNITGGYKALIPFSTIFCQFNRIRAYYLFQEDEKSKEKFELISFPVIPINLDYNFFEKNINNLKLLNKGVDNFYELKKTIPKELYPFIWSEEDLAELNSIGKYFFNKYESHLIIYMLKGMASTIPEQKYSKRLYDSFDSLYSQLEKYLISNSNLINANTNELKKCLDEQGECALNHGPLKNSEYYIFKAP
ncbi:MAG TPA: hypothetical protein PLS71_12995, partial [Leptospiraceae bacterium]|nr:hypothetical protein [Leptospiraceae bacterium]